MRAPSRRRAARRARIARAALAPERRCSASGAHHRVTGPIPRRDGGATARSISRRLQPARRLRARAAGSAASWRSPATGALARTATAPSSIARRRSRRRRARRARIGAEKEGEAQAPHGQDRARHAVRLPAPAGGRHARGKAGRPRQALKPAATARCPPSAGCRDSRRRLAKARARDEDRLVAGGDAGEPRAQVHQRRDHAEEPDAAPAMRTSKRPHARARRRAPRRRCAIGRRAAAACRRAGTGATSPVAAAAPAFIWRGAAARAPRAPGRRSAGARATVPSALPPSTTITSAPPARSGARASRCVAIPSRLVEDRDDAPTAASLGGLLEGAAAARSLPGRAAVAMAGDADRRARRDRLSRRSRRCAAAPPPPSGSFSIWLKSQSCRKPSIIDADERAAHDAVEIVRPVRALRAAPCSRRTAPSRSASSRSAGSACWRGRRGR